MVYEFCNEIKNSGINRNAFPASCGSYMEMGMYITLDTTRAINSIFQEAGTAELNGYKNSVLTEASAKEIAKKVKDAVVKALTKAWEGIKAVWEKIVNTIHDKIKEYEKKIATKFEALDLKQYKTAIDKAFSGSGMFLVDTSKIDKVGAKIDASAEKIKKSVEESLDKVIGSHQSKVDALTAPYGLILGDAFGNKYSEITNATEAKNVIDQMIKADFVKLTAETIMTNQKKIADIISENGTKKDVKKAYAGAKKAYDAALKAFKSVKEDDPNLRIHARCLCNIALAHQNLLLELAQARKDCFIKALQIASRCSFICKVGRKDKEEAVKEAFFDKDAINEAYAVAITEGVYVVQEAKFSFLPKFKSDPNLAKLQNDAKEAEMLLNKQGVDPKTGLHKAFQIIFKVLSIFENVGSVFTTIPAFLLVGMIPHLIIRAWAWAFDCGEEHFAKEQTKKVITQLSQLKDKTKDKAEKEKISKAIEKLEKRLDRVENPDKDELDESALAFDEAFVNEAFNW